MYQAVKSDEMSEADARKIAGIKAVDRALGENCDFTGRVIDDCFNVEEMSASVDFVDADGEERILTILYLVDKVEAMETDDLGSLDYTDYTFTIN